MNPQYSQPYPLAAAISQEGQGSSKEVEGLQQSFLHALGAPFSRWHVDEGKQEENLQNKSLSAPGSLGGVVSFAIIRGVPIS